MSNESVYTSKPWLKHYPKDIPSEVEIPVQSVAQAFDEAVKKFKGKPAIIFYGRKFSFGELGERVNRLARALADLGVKKGDVVGLLMLNSPEYVIAFYSVTRLGAIVTPISPVYVSSEIKHQIIESGADTIICHDMLWEAVEGTGLDIPRVIMTNISESLPTLKKLLGKSVLKEIYQKMAVPDVKVYEREGFYQLKDLISRYPPDPPHVQIDPKEDILILPFTGGTTGLPKGVGLTHYNALAGYTNFCTFYPSISMEAQERVVAYMPYYHQFGTCSLVMRSILRGFTQVVITSPDLDEIINAMVRYNTTFFVGAPAMYEMLKDYKKRDRVNWKKQKVLMSGADALHEYTQKDWQERTGVPIHDMWGMTECVDLLIGTPLGKPKIGSIGVPITNVMAAILDPDEDTFLPIGELGELVLSSPTVTSKGYWKNPQSTKDCEVFINGIRWWRTGDMARMDEDGYFFIYDRKRDLIKYKGLRIFAREVEEVLNSHPDIKGAGVIGVKDLKVGQIVKAVVVLESEARGKYSEADIIEYCKGKLTSYKIPRIVEFVGEIPKTDVGKVSRREIREEAEEG